MNTQPVLIRGGVAYPITAAQVELGRRGKPMGPIAGLDATARPRAAAPVAHPAPQPPKSDGRAASRASMLKAIGDAYGKDARATADAKLNPRDGRDPKLSAIGERPAKAPAATSATARGADGLTMGQRSMLAAVGRAQGEAARAQAEARLRARAA